MPFLSSAYLNSASCEKELSYADKLNVPILPILLENDFDPNSWLGAEFEITKNLIAIILDNLVFNFFNQNLCFFTPFFLLFFTSKFMFFLHQILCFLHQIFLLFLHQNFCFFLPQKFWYFFTQKVMFFYTKFFCFFLHQN